VIKTDGGHAWVTNITDCKYRHIIQQAIFAIAVKPTTVSSLTSFDMVPPSLLTHPSWSKICDWLKQRSDPNDPDSMINVLALFHALGKRLNLPSTFIFLFCCYKVEIITAVLLRTKNQDKQ
jgi:hypothetical protein